MNKKDVIEILYRSAVLYDKNLKNKNLLIVYGQPDSPKFIETYATDNNFIHLTGINITNPKISPAKFYENILDKKVSVNDFELKKDGTSELKLSILPYISEINKHAKMMGVYNNSRPRLKTEKLVGNIVASLGFIRTGKYFVPNTALKGDIRDDIEKCERVLVIFSKKVTDSTYTQVESSAKGVDHHKTAKYLSSYLPIDTELT